jgi:ATP-dependent phosphofructokinase / diphosphate-dependent phosphofructokinase
MKRNALVAQSGGPSPVINASLQGVVDACRDYPGVIGEVYAARHGVEGLLREELLDLGRQPPDELALLRVTPAAGAIGTCRYKLTAEQAEDFERIVDVLRAHDIGYVFYIGGNDSMDTARKVSELAAARGADLAAVGVPKTIDNDIGDPDFRLIDHTPGYGSAARYWASMIQNVNEENRGMAPSECVSVLQAMGRTSGFIPAASRLADPAREMPLLIGLTESGHTLDDLAAAVDRRLVAHGRCMVVVSEGFDVGGIGEARDGFGHIEYGAGRMAAAQVVCNHLNARGFPVRGQATWQQPGVLQRCTSMFASCVDMDEAYAVGRHAVAIAIRDGGGWMATLLREPGPGYAVRYDKVPLDGVANAVRHLPGAWLSEDGWDVTDAFVRYARPLIGDAWPPLRLEDGRQRFARLAPLYIAPTLPRYVPVRHRF